MNNRIKNREQLIIENFHGVSHRISNINHNILDEGVSEKLAQARDWVMSKMPGVKASAENTYSIVGSEIAKAVGVAKEQLNDPENQAKVKGGLGRLKAAGDELSSSMSTALKDPTKLERVIKTLKVGTWGSLISGVAVSLFNMGTVFAFAWPPMELSVGVVGPILVKLALVLFIIRLIVQFLGGVSAISQTIKGMAGTIKNTIGALTGSSNENVSLYAAINSLQLVENQMIQNKMNLI